MVDDPRFDVPPELRELVEKNVEQAQAAYGQFIDFLTQVSSMAPPSKMLPGLEAVRERAIEFAKENGERFFDLANALVPCQGYPGGADPSKPVRANSDAVIRCSGQRAWRDVGTGITRLWPNDRHPLSCRTLPP